MNASVKFCVGLYHHEISMSGGPREVELLKEMPIFVKRSPLWARRRSGRKSMTGSKKAIRRY
ncbi:MAG: hypothetical protein HYX49_04445 [Chloroflexi bacterium]|nr:hypothetical protein [Chloroflexota bacterium]